MLRKCIANILLLISLGTVIASPCEVMADAGVKVQVGAETSSMALSADLALHKARLEPSADFQYSHSTNHDCGGPCDFNGNHCAHHQCHFGHCAFLFTSSPEVRFSSFSRNLMIKNWKPVQFFSASLLRPPIL